MDGCLHLSFENAQCRFIRLAGSQAAMLFLTESAIAPIQDLNLLTAAP